MTDFLGKAKRYEIPFFTAPSETYTIVEQKIEPMGMPTAGLHFLEASFTYIPADPLMDITTEAIANDIQASEDADILAALEIEIARMDEGKETAFPPSICWEPLEDCDRLDGIG